MKDRYHFSEKLDKEKSGDRFYDDYVLSTAPDDRISARREARRERAVKKAEPAAPAFVELAKQKPRARKNIRWGRLILAALVFAAVIVFAGYEGVRLTRLQIEKMQAQKELANLNMKLDQLGDELEALDSDEYVENSARSNLHMIKDGEVMYIVNPDLGKEDESESGAKPE